MTIHHDKLAYGKLNPLRENVSEDRMAKMLAELNGGEGEFSSSQENCAQSFAEKLKNADKRLFWGEKVTLKPVETEEELLCVADLKLTNDTDLKSQDCLTCIVLCDEKPVGYINFCKWQGLGEASSWNLLICESARGRGYGRDAAQTAARVLKAAEGALPVKLAVGRTNLKAQRFFKSLGYELSEEIYGDDLVFILK